MTHLRVMIAVLTAFLFSLPAYSAEESVNAAFEGASIDLFPYLQAVETDKTAVSIELPADGASDRVLMQLSTIGPERIHRWAIVTLANPTQSEQDLVIATPVQGFVGSGVLWPARSGPRIQNVIVAGTAATQPLASPGSDALALRLAPVSLTTLAFELTPAGLNEMVLWKRQAFEARVGALAFFRGVVLGIALLMAVAMLSLYAVRVTAAFPFAAVFALASAGFIALEAGYLPELNAMLPDGYRMGDQARALVESAMLAGLILCLVGFVDLRKRWPLAGNAFLLAAALAVALAVYGWFEPTVAIGLARIFFALAAVAGFIVIVGLWREGFTRAHASLLPWSMVVLWTFGAAMAALTASEAGLWTPVLIAGLVLVLLTMGFVLAQFAFSQGFVAQHLFEESGRRALALAGSQQYVWDWQVDDQVLHIGEDLEKALGLIPGTVVDGGPEGWLELIHPADRKSYIVAIEAAERRGHGAFSLEFRLRRGDGTYRWFLLRGRVMPGSDRRPLRCIGTLTDVTGTRRAQEQLLNDAVHDRVTGLPNRALLADRIDRAIAAIEEGRPSDLYLLLLDLDRFATVNDGLGYETGDGLLNITGRRLAAVASQDDTVARLPGDQFAILFSGGKSARDIVAFTEVIRKAISRPISMRTQEIFLTASLGVAGYREKGQTAEDLLKDAAIALYEAKRRGKDTVEFFRTSMRDDRSELVALESELRRALERNEIEVAYQPIARLADMDLAGFEALIRWRHRSLGLLGPESFLTVAETTGIIKDLGRFVLNDAARNLGIWQRAFRAKQPLFVAVNISSSQLIGTELVDEVKAIVTREGIQRDTLKIEITESMVMQNPELSVQVLDRLKQMGVGLSCDDFGTGYSSLSNLRRMPFDTLKVDRSFIEPDPRDDKAAVILETIVLLAHELGLAVVAEGIQSQEHVDRLGDLGCDMGQGNFIGEPMTAKQVVDALSGLPYAASRHKNVIAALWERVSGTGEVTAPSPVWHASIQDRAPPPPPPPPPPPSLSQAPVPEAKPPLPERPAFAVPRPFPSFSESRRTSSIAERPASPEPPAKVETRVAKPEPAAKVEEQPVKAEPLVKLEKGPAKPEAVVKLGQRPGKVVDRPARREAAEKLRERSTKSEPEIKVEAKPARPEPAAKVEDRVAEPQPAAKAKARPKPRPEPGPEPEGVLADPEAGGTEPRKESSAEPMVAERSVPALGAAPRAPRRQLVKSESAPEPTAQPESSELSPPPEVTGGQVVVTNGSGEIHGEPDTLETGAGAGDEPLAAPVEPEGEDHEMGEGEDVDTGGAEATSAEPAEPVSTGTTGARKLARRLRRKGRSRTAKTTTSPS